MTPAGGSARPSDVAAEALRWLEAESDPTTRAQMGPRYGIHTEQAYGVPMARMKALAKRLGTDHDLAAELWASGWYEARIVASMVDDPAAVTSDQMDAWCAAFDNWAIVDTVCFNLFDRTPHAWAKIDEWAADERELVKRTAFALLWSLANHDRDSPDEQFAERLQLVELHATDDRHLVNKAVGMALRAIGKRRASLLPRCLEAAERLADSDEPAARRVGRPAVRELRRAAG